MFQATALEVFLEFLPNMFRQGAAPHCKLRLECGKVLFEKLMQQGALSFLNLPAVFCR